VRLEESLRANPRRVLVVYDLSWQAYAVFDEFPFLWQAGNFETLSRDYAWCYYENVLYRPAS
jgi:hypothetical protein